MDNRIIRSWATPVKAADDKINGLGLVFFDGSEGTRQAIGRGKFEALAPDVEITHHRGDVIATFNHNYDNILGRQSNGTLDIESNDNGIAYSIKLNPDDSAHQSVRAKINRGDVAGSSAKFSILSHRWEKDTLLYDAIELIEIGPVTMPAMTNTTARTAFDEGQNDFARLAVETQERFAKFVASYSR